MGPIRAIRVSVTGKKNERIKAWKVKSKKIYKQVTQVNLNGKLQPNVLLGCLESKLPFARKQPLIGVIFVSAKICMIYCGIFRFLFAHRCCISHVAI